MVQSVDEGAGEAFLDPDESELDSLVVLDDFEELESEDLDAESEPDELPP